MKLSFLFKINFAVILICLCDAALSPKIKEMYHGFLSGKGLYTQDDGIVILNATNVNRTIYNTENAWLVEFYNSWCGHCHKFAPIWKTLAAELSEWSHVVRLAAIDCANEENTSTCREYDIVAYPTVKFFSAFSQWPSLGSGILRTSQSVSEIIRDLVGILQKEQLEGRGQTWPNIIPYRSYDTKNLWKGAEGTRYIFLIFADANDPLAPEVTLDLSHVKEIEIRGVVADNEILSKLLGVTSIPSLLVMDKLKEQPQSLTPDENTRSGFRLAIKSFLSKVGISVPDEPSTVNILPPNEMPSVGELQEARDNLLQLQKIKELGDVVFLADLDNTLRYSLEHEIPSRKLISGESFRALNKFLGVLAKYFPMGESGVTFIQNLRDAVLEKTEIRGMKFKTYLGNLSNGGLDSVVATKGKWMGCRGSESYLRGYPCGVWTLFHYMTVNALDDSRNPHFDPLEVLEAMTGYVTYFFGCTPCSKHFQQMANRDMKERVTNGEEAVLWLWSAHNEVNDRLSKDKTEDPEFPKIQFPSGERCSKCRNADGSWEKWNVLNYLKSVYSQDSLNQLGSNTKLYFRNRSVSEESPRNEPELANDKINKEFNMYDVSLCVALYTVSGLILLGVSLKFILKRRRRRKSHGQDLLGRV